MTEEIADLKVPLQLESCIKTTNLIKKIAFPNSDIYKFINFEDFHSKHHTFY